MINNRETCISYKKKLSSHEMEQVTIEDCKRGKLLQSSKDIGFKCGLYNYKITSEEGGNYQICYFVNDEILKGGEVSKDIFNNILLSLNENNRDMTYQLEIVNSDGKSASYDSKTNKMTYSNSNFHDKFSILLLPLILVLNMM